MASDPLGMLQTTSGKADSDLGPTGDMSKCKSVGNLLRG